MAQAINDPGTYKGAVERLPDGAKFEESHGMPGSEGYEEIWDYQGYYKYRIRLTTGSGVFSRKVYTVDRARDLERM